jgi:LPS export ABC transporter permease LptF/LPS export ABC transporter permease LptG
LPQYAAPRSRRIVLKWRPAMRPVLRLIDRYILREVFSHTLIGLAIFTFVFFVPQLVHLMELVVRHTTTWADIGMLFLCTLPPMLSLTLPMGLLVGMLIGLGRLSADSELIAMNALGMGRRRLLFPVGMLALAFTALTAVLTIWTGPAAVHTSRALQNRIASSQASFEVEPRVFDERFPHMVLYVQDVSAVATRWHGVFLASTDPQEDSRLTLAEEAIVIADPEQGKLELHLRDGSVHQVDVGDPDHYALSAFGERDWPIDASGPDTEETDTPTLAELTTSGLLEGQTPPRVTDPILARVEARVELQRRLAFPAACLAFAMLAIPLASRPRRGGRAGGFLVTLLLVSAYYVLFTFGAGLARNGALPAWVGIWLPNAMVALVGLALLPSMGRIGGEGWVTRVSSKLGGWRTGRNKLAGSAAEAAPTRKSHARPRRAGLGSVLDRYVLRGFLFYFALLLAGFILLFGTFTFFELLDDISRHHTPWLHVANYFRFLSVSNFYQFAPLAALTAVLVTLGVLAKNNEIVAFKAAGISLYRVSLPLLTMGLILAGGLVLLGDTYLPYANRRQDELFNEMKGRPPQTYRSPQHQWIFGENSKIYNYDLFDSDHNLFGGLSVFELDPTTFELRRRVYATRAHWFAQQHTWILESGWVRDFQDGRVTSYVPFVVEALPELAEPPDYFRREVRQSNQMNGPELGRYITSLERAGFDVARLSVQLYKKLAFPLIAPIIMLLAIPFSLLVGTRGAVGGLALGLGIGILYWAVSALFEAMGAVGQLPPFMAAWSPDVIFGFLALYFFLRMPT